MDRSRFSGLAAVACIAGAVGCISPSEPAEPLTCESPGLSTQDWRTVSQSVVTFKVPSSYQNAAGSNRWRSGRAWVELLVLLPGIVKTDSIEVLTNYVECRSTVRGRRLVIQLGETSISGQYGPGWYLSANWGTAQVPSGDLVPVTATVVMEAWTPTEGLIEEILAVFWSVLVNGAGP